MMRAVVMRGGDISTEDVTEPTPGPGQVLIAPHATGICGSDLHAREVLTELAAADPQSPPMTIIPGHEFAGHIVAIGPDTAADLNVGDLVTSIPFTPGPAGPETIGLSPNFGGGLAELTVADATRTFRLPDGVDARLGALSEPVAVAVHAYNLAAADGPVVIIGAGPIGQGVIAVASVNGRHPIIVVEPAPQRRAAALRVGADTAHEPGVPLLELLAAVGYTPSTMSPLLDGEPRSVTIFECVGRANVVQSILAEAPPHSQIVLAGACHAPVEINPLQLTTAEVSVTASFAYRPAEFHTAMTHLHQQPDLFGQFITSEHSLDRTADAFDALATNPDEVKVLINPAVTA